MGAAPAAKARAPQPSSRRRRARPRTPGRTQDQGEGGRAEKGGEVDLVVEAEPEGEPGQPQVQGASRLPSQGGEVETRAAAEQREGHRAPVVAGDEQQRWIGEQERAAREGHRTPEHAVRPQHHEQHACQRPEGRRDPQHRRARLEEREARNQQLALECSHVGLGHPREGPTKERGRGQARGMQCARLTAQEVEARPGLDRLVVEEPRSSPDTEPRRRDEVQPSPAMPRRATRFREDMAQPPV